jgi:hypothetical protein
MQRDKLSFHITWLSQLNLRGDNSLPPTGSEATSQGSDDYYLRWEEPLPGLLGILGISQMILADW